MIKVNLLRNQGQSAGTVTTGDINYETTFDADAMPAGGGGLRAAVPKLVIMFLGIACLMAYEYYNIGDLESRMHEINAKKTAIANEMREKKTVAEKAKALQKQVHDLEARIHAIKDLSRVRLREIKIIDYIQNIIPERVWLTTLDFAEESLKIEGATLSDDQLNKFIEDLEGKSYFRNVILVKAVEQKGGKEGTVKVFQITTDLASAD